MKFAYKLLSVFSGKTPPKQLTTELQQALKVGKDQMETLKKKGLSIRVVML